MIIGVGTDIINIKRIENIFQKYGDAFLKKNFHQAEIDKFNKLATSLRAPYLAKRFAAKEAFAKAFGIGIGKEFAFCDIAVINDELGVPKIVISDKKIPNIANVNINVSLSDDYPFAVAFVVISK